MIQMISGACRVGSKLMRPADKPFSMSAEEEEYLVKQGVAKYVAEEALVEEVATPPAGQEQTDAVVNSGEAEGGTEGDEGGDDDVPAVKDHFVKADLLKLTREDLNKLAGDLGIEGADECANKGDVADLIVAVEVGNDDGDDMPVLGAEGPVE